jgi:hypothetical protein
MRNWGGVAREVGQWRFLLHTVEISPDGDI